MSSTFCILWKHFSRSLDAFGIHRLLRVSKLQENLKKDVEKLEALSTFEVAEHLSPKGQIMTRDTVVLGQGTQVPPHINLLAEVMSVRHAFAICHAAGEIATKAGSHMERKFRRRKATERIGTNVFIGHGRRVDGGTLRISCRID